jgi:curved DNA-binding protein CbpA
MEYPAPGWSHDDPYRVLGVNRGACRQDIARAYRRAVHDAHPDAQPTDPRAAARFQALTDAYDLLSDPASRADHDRTRRPMAGPGSQPPPARYPAVIRRWPGSPYAPGPPRHVPVWAGPVRTGPSGSGRGSAAQASPQHQASPPGGEVEDPPIILGTRPGWAWGWLW